MKIYLFTDTFRGFTNKLRNLLKEKFPGEKRTLGYFERENEDEMREIRSNPF
jgi:hypothetical protein